MKNIGNPKSEAGRARAFTLVELLIVIAIMGIIAGFTIPVLQAAKDSEKKSVARSELNGIVTALEGFKAKYGAYPPGNSPVNPLFNQLFYELSGTALNGANFVALDGSAPIKIVDVPTKFGVGGFVNCTKGGGEDGVVAKNFLSGISPKMVYYNWTNNLADGIATANLVTSVGGPDANYHPLNPVGGTGPNPFRYVCPGVNNPGSYDLWVQLVIRGKFYLICNWSDRAIASSPLP